MLVRQSNDNKNFSRPKWTIAAAENKKDKKLNLILMLYYHSIKYCASTLCSNSLVRFNIDLLQAAQMR